MAGIQSLKRKTFIVHRATVSSSPFCYTPEPICFLTAATYWENIFIEQDSRLRCESFHQGACKSLTEMKSLNVSVHLVIFMSSNLNVIGPCIAKLLMFF